MVKGKIAHPSFLIKEHYPISAPLSGHFKIEVHDEVYARATIGILGLNIDFFLASVCFKGGATYNLNLLQVKYLVIFLLYIHYLWTNQELMSNLYFDLYIKLYKHIVLLVYFFSFIQHHVLNSCN